MAQRLSCAVEMHQLLARTCGGFFFHLYDYDRAAFICAHLVRLSHTICPCAGSGQVIDQGARLVDMALEDGSAFKLDGWKYISEAFAEHTVHFIGLLSDGGVHSRIDQLLGFVRGAAKDGAKRIRVHILTVRARCCIT